MSTETDRIVNPAARRFHGYDGDQPIHLGAALHVDKVGDRFFVGENPEGGQFRIYTSRLELIEAAQAILRHFGASA